ncbi:hypothetical protein E4U52_003304 [Claviceps spartinae]|nr:hypothetical protein E4U52_003304 [Claviceps spartinae]
MESSRVKEHPKKNSTILKDFLEHEDPELRKAAAYIASVCQPEALYDLSAASQVQDLQPTDIDKLDKRIQWQMSNPDVYFSTRVMIKTNELGLDRHRFPATHAL